MEKLPTTPKEAKELGSPRYFSGIPCKRGHLAERFTQNATCMECHARGTPQQRKAAKARYRFKKRFGQSLEIKTEAIARQEGACAICRRTDQKLVMDHCHSTGSIRDALCHNCNVALGHAADDPARLRAMADYLERHQ